MDGHIKQEKGTNLGQDECKIQPASSGLELKFVVHSKLIFKGLVDTVADFCLLGWNVFC